MRRPQNLKSPRKKISPQQEAALSRAEHHYAKSVALMAGAAKILDGFVAGTSWGDETTVDVCIELLEEARAERLRARENRQSAEGPR